jgi:hypothetical protein
MLFSSSPREDELRRALIQECAGKKIEVPLFLGSSLHLRASWSIVAGEQGMGEEGD